MKRINDYGRKLVYVCSPLQGAIREDRQKAIEYSKKVYEESCIPITPHAYFPLFLSDEIDRERNDGITMGMQMLYMCDEVWVFGNQVTKEMEIVINEAKRKGIPILFYFSKGEMLVKQRDFDAHCNCI